MRPRSASLRPLVLKEHLRHVWGKSESLKQVCGFAASLRFAALARLRNVWGTFEASLKQVCSKFEATLKQFWSNFETNLKQIWGMLDAIYQFWAILRCQAHFGSILCSQKLPEAAQKLLRSSKKLPGSSQEAFRKLPEAPRGSQKLARSCQKLPGPAQELPRAHFCSKYIDLGIDFATFFDDFSDAFRVLQNLQKWWNTIIGLISWWPLTLLWGRSWQNSGTTSWWIIQETNKDMENKILLLFWLW